MAQGLKIEILSPNGFERRGFQSDFGAVMSAKRDWKYGSNKKVWKWGQESIFVRSPSNWPTCYSGKFDRGLGLLANWIDQRAAETSQPLERLEMLKRN